MDTIRIKDPINDGFIEIKSPKVAIKPQQLNPAAVKRMKDAFKNLMEGKIPDFEYIDMSIPNYEELTNWNLMIEFINPHPNYLHIK